LSTKTQELTSKTTQIKELNQVVANQTTQIQNLNNTLSTKTQELTSKTTQIKELNQVVANQTTQIQNLNNTLNKTIKEKDLVINSGINQINQLQNNMQEKITQLNQLQFRLSFQSQHGTAKQRIQNQLSYKLGQTMIINSKNIFGILFMPVYIISTLLSHKQEQKIYQEKIKKDPSLKLPPLESYPDYKEALKFKNHLSYKLGQALIKANKTWYKGGYVKVIFEIRKLKKVKI
ncbi:alpha-2,3-sialyltransferase, partial [Campylobacter coli]